jgi:hypothetical protein
MLEPNLKEVGKRVPQNETWAKKFARDSCKQNMERNVQQKRVPISKKKPCRQTFDKKNSCKEKNHNKNEFFYE